ncbi:MAG TPA: hypothetical protein VIL71_07525 [Spirillospora sp.]
MPESVLAEEQARGSFDGVAVTSEGAPLAFVSQAAPGANTGRAWDVTAGVAIGPPIPDFPADHAGWAFGAPAGSPLVAWTHRDRVHVHDLGTGHEATVEGEPELLGLTVHGGRPAVAAVFGPASDAEVVVWDALTGDPLTEFGVWLGHRTAVGRCVLHATPATGPLIGVPGDAALSILDVERGEEITTLPPSHAVLAPSPDGLVVVQAGESGLDVRGLDGDRLAVLTAPSPCDQIAAAQAGGGLLVAVVPRDDPAAVLVWNAAAPAPAHRVEIASPVNDLAVAPDGTLLVATDAGLHQARLRP